MPPEAPRSVWAAVLAGIRALAGPTLPLPPPRRLSCCPACGGDRSPVVGRSRHGEGLALLHLRCGDCELQRHVVVSRREVEALDALHASQREEIEQALASLHQEAALTAPKREKESR